MQQDLTQRAIDILADEWRRWEERPTPKDYPSSKAVYDRLIAEGWTVPDNALRELWTQLDMFGYIRAAMYQANRDRWRTDGLADFVHVDLDRLDEA